MQVSLIKTKQKIVGTLLFCLLGITNTSHGKHLMRFMFTNTVATFVPELTGDTYQKLFAF